MVSIAKKNKKEEMLASLRDHKRSLAQKVYYFNY